MFVLDLTSDIVLNDVGLMSDLDSFFLEALEMELEPIEIDTNPVVLEPYDVSLDEIDLSLD